MVMDYLAKDFWLEIQDNILDKFEAFGHPNILGTHFTTFEFTTENFLTPRGNCIIGINATKSANDLSEKLKEYIKSGKKVGIFLRAGPYWDNIIGFGNSNLSLSNKISMVFRRSEFRSDRTVLIGCSKVSIEIDRNLITFLQDPSHKIQIFFYAPVQVGND